MKIVSLIHREGGTKIDLDGKIYKFLPDEEGRHVCEVANKDHAKRLLSITEGFEAFVEEAEKSELAGLSKAELAKMYEQKTGNIPPAAMNKDKLSAAIEAFDKTEDSEAGNGGQAAS